MVRQRSTSNLKKHQLRGIAVVGIVYVVFLVIMVILGRDLESMHPVIAIAIIPSMVITLILCIMMLAYATHPTESFFRAYRVLCIVFLIVGVVGCIYFFFTNEQAAMFAGMIVVFSGGSLSIVGGIDRDT